MNDREFAAFENKRPVHKWEIARWARANPDGEAGDAIKALEFPYAGDQDMYNYVRFHIHRARVAEAEAPTAADAGNVSGELS